MAQLETLPDECLLLVLDWLSPKQLFKMHRINRKMKRLAAEKLRTKIKAIEIKAPWRTEADFTNCTHIGTVTTDQVLVLKQFKDLHQQSEKDQFLNILSRCSSIKSIDFGNRKLPDDLLTEVFRRCPELECIKLAELTMTSAKLRRMLNEIGQRLVHLVKNGVRDESRDSLAKADSVRLTAVASMCPNIKRVDWTIGWRLTEGLISAIKSLPNDCWVALSCNHDNKESPLHVFEDVVDEYDIGFLDWNALSRRFERLSSLKIFSFLEYGQEEPEPSQKVEFAALKKLEVKTTLKFDVPLWNNNIDFLIAGKYPRLEEVRISPTGMTEDDYSALFQTMPSVKKLIIDYDYSTSAAIEEELHLPGEVIHQLKNLEHLYVDVIDSTDEEEETVNLLKQLEQYVDEVSSLKKLTVGMESGCYSNDLQFEKRVEGVERLKLKQSGVEVELKITNKNQSDDGDRELNPEQVGSLDPNYYKDWFKQVENYQRSGQIFLNRRKNRRSDSTSSESSSSGESTSD